MAVPRPPEMALFFVGVLAKSASLLPTAARALEERYGPPFLASGTFPFVNTDYYIDELGANPVRAFLAWPAPYPTDRIAGDKLAANALEIELAEKIGGSSRRPINLDPGYLTLAKLVLASAKNFAHRIHVGNGIYAEVTLQYRGGRFVPLPWTFPDYAAETYHAFFLDLRKRVYFFTTGDLSHGS